MTYAAAFLAALTTLTLAVCAVFAVQHDDPVLALLCAVVATLHFGPLVWAIVDAGRGR